MSRFISSLVKSLVKLSVPLAVVMLFSSNVYANECSIPPEARTDAGFSGISQAQCQGRGACWDNSQPNTIWCYNSKSQLIIPSAEDCDIGVPGRLDSGYPGISETECKYKNGCWDSSQPDTLWCYRPKNRVTCRIQIVNYRIEGGFEGIPRQQCLDRGMCYDNTLSGTFFETDEHGIATGEILYVPACYRPVADAIECC